MKKIIVGEDILGLNRLPTGPFLTQNPQPLKKEGQSLNRLPTGPFLTAAL